MKNEINKISRPCPICGGKMEVVTNWVADSYTNPNGDNPPYIFLRCCCCGVQSPNVISRYLDDDSKSRLANALIFYWDNRRPDTPNMDALAPCPLCGGEATLRERSKDAQVDDPDEDGDYDFKGGWDGLEYLPRVSIECGNCGCSTSDEILLEPRQPRDVVKFLWNYNHGKDGASWLQKN